MSPKVPDLSVVIPTCNRQELLLISLPALAGLQTNGFAYEVLFVNDGSTDGTAQIISDALRKWPGTFRLLSLPHSGTPARPRNIGIRNARGRILLLLDDDIVPDLDLLVEHWRFHQTNSALNVLVTGELYQPKEVLTDPLSLFHSFPYHELRERKDLGFLFFWSCNISGKTRFLQKYGLFDEDPALHPVEDMEWGYRLKRQNAELFFLPSARGKHLHKMDRSDVVRKGQRTGRAQFALTLKVPDTSVKERFGIVSADLPVPRIAWRALRRVAFRLVDNLLTVSLLKALGAERSRRNRITDAYYYLLFRRSIVAGYKQARRESRSNRARLDFATPRGKEA